MLPPAPPVKPSSQPDQPSRLPFPLIFVLRYLLRESNIEEQSASKARGASHMKLDLHLLLYGLETES